jgi:uncharacterized protein YfaS (alpha-2-macroglobulin family)
VGIFAATGGVPLGQMPLIDNQSINADTLSKQVGDLSEKLTAFEKDLQVVNSIQSGVDKIQSDIQQRSDDFDDDMTVIENQVKRLSDQVDELKEKLDKLTIGTAVFSAELNRSEVKAGDTLTLTGTGLPNKQVKVTLLGIDKLILSEGSATTDSNGNFVFSTQVSRSYAPGEYTVKLSQEGKVIQRSFNLAGTDGGTTQPATQSPSTTPTPSPQPPVTQGSLTLSVDKSQYARGDKVMLSGRTDADVWIDLDIFDSNKVQQVRTATKSDSNGNYRFEYTLASNAALGEYEISASNGNKLQSVKFSVVQSGSGSTTQPASTSGSLTATADKTQYARGDLVKISGKAPAKSKVTILVEPPSGDDLLLSVTASDSGTYQTLFSIKADAVNGTWNITVKQDNNIVTATIKVV